MKLMLLVMFFSHPCVTLQNKNLEQNFDKQVFYGVMAEGKLDDINKELDLLNSATVNEKEAYEGALMMRKSGLLKVAGEKLKFFKKGRIKLETALLHDNDNCEYHFLRLTIQEHAPKLVKYRAELESDKQFIVKVFKSLPSDIQEIIRDYSKNSKVLNRQDL